METLRSQSLSTASSESPPERVEGILDLNLLPARHLPRRLDYRTVAFWLLFVLLLALLIPNLQRFQGASQALALQRSELAVVRRDLMAAQAEPSEMEDLRLAIAEAESRLRDLEAAKEAIAIQAITWGPTVASIHAAAPESVQVDSIEQVENQVTLMGMSAAYRDALVYGESMRRQNKYDQVVVTFIRRLEPEAEVQMTPEDTGAISSNSQGEEDAAGEPKAETLFQYAFEIRVTLPVTIEYEAPGSESE